MRHITLIGFALFFIGTAAYAGGSRVFTDAAQEAKCQSATSSPSQDKMACMNAGTIASAKN